jgi:hypothetical protein
MFDHAVNVQGTENRRGALVIDNHDTIAARRNESMVERWN